MHPVVMAEIAKMRAEELRNEAQPRSPAGRHALREAFGWKLVGAGLRLVGSAAIAARIGGRA